MAKSSDSGCLFGFIAIAVVVSIIIENIEIFIGIAIFALIIFLLVRNAKKTKNQSKTKNYSQKTYTSKSIPKYTQKQTIDYSSSSSSGVPHWSHTYIYSSSDLDYANYLQKAFYYRFKKEFLRGNVLNIEGNTNYAFILYFDLLEEYQSHKNIVLLEKQFDMLGECCPKTKQYYFPVLLELLNEKNDDFSKRKIEELKAPSYQDKQGLIYDYESYYKLGYKYKSILGLNNQEQRWLNKFYLHKNVFTSIEGCCIMTIKLYLIALNILNKRLNANNTSLSKEVAYFKDKVAEVKGRNDYYGYEDKKYLQERAESEIYLSFFKRCENYVREAYNSNRRVSTECSYLFSYTDEFEEKIGSLFDNILLTAKSIIEPPDKNTQIELNVTFVNRWKNKFEEITSTFNSNNIIKYAEEIEELEEMNHRNPNIENIMFESSKFIAKYDKVLSLQYYAKYIHYDLHSKKIDNKPLNKTVQKSLFSNQKQVEKFEDIINRLINGANIAVIIEELSKFYIRERKKIKLDDDKVKEAKLKHKDTVNILNEFLEDADETEEGDEIQINIQRDAVTDSIYKPEIYLSSFEEIIIDQIKDNSFVISQNEIEKIAIEQGMFKNQLIDNINDKCNEMLNGEMLIEEDEDNYVIEESYYLELLKD